MRVRASLALPALALLLAAGAQAEGRIGAAPSNPAQSAQADSGRSSAPSGERAVDPRPEDPTANLPSDSGAQSELPSGAVTGAGLPHGTIKQPDLGLPGGLEERARAQARAEAQRAGGSTIERNEPADKGASQRPHTRQP